MANRIRLNNPLIDGRQSERALAVQRGVQRYLRRLGWFSACEIILANGRRADIFCLNDKGEIWIIEIKSSLEDLRADQKWPEYRDYCDQISFATLADVPLQAFPADAGLIIADAYGAEEVRPAPLHKLSAARRKSVTLRAMKQITNKLHDILDPERVELSGY
ncbi:MmcB family DNA repair protein [Polycladidibacter hongkongensis]|uniref:MmcB family DNA repair protein n=1 Tax=Polycladidibacter hongkongensis TaxID=1647556 RepID=UPI0008315EA7|nr:MmcB family DNA repair protein [Pseudovibrio hongkongensis]